MRYWLVRLPCFMEDEGREDSYGTFATPEQAEVRRDEVCREVGGYWKVTDFEIREVRVIKLQEP